MRRYLIAGTFVLGMAWTGSSVALEETAQKKPTLPVGKVYEVIVEKESFAFAPQVSTIKLGDVVRWVNHDTQKHLVVSQDPTASTRDLLVYHTLPPGESFEFQFVHPDNYNFFCAIHFQMWGTVGVTP
jgi:plastocyanin